MCFFHNFAKFIVLSPCRFCQTSKYLPFNTDFMTSLLAVGIKRSHAKIFIINKKTTKAKFMRATYSYLANNCKMSEK